MPCMSDSEEPTVLTSKIPDTERRKLVVFDVTEDTVELLQIDDGVGFELPRELLPPDLRAGDVLRVIAKVERAGVTRRE